MAPASMASGRVGSLTEGDAADRLGLKVATLRAWRSTASKGPAFVRLGRAVRSILSTNWTSSCARIATRLRPRRLALLSSTKPNERSGDGSLERGKRSWLDAIVHGHRYREPLGTTDWREAKRLERQRIEQLEGRATVPTAQSLTYAALDVSPRFTRMPRSGGLRSRSVWPRTGSRTPARSPRSSTTPSSGTCARTMAAYQNARTDAGHAPKTMNGELQSSADPQARQALV